MTRSHSGYSSKRIFVFLVLTLSAARGTSQSASIDAMLPHYFQSAPNSASLNKYGDYPVSYFSGLPQISIPLYEIKQGKLSVPVTLDYHASGNRVTDAASWVGLGWSLNAGGEITRKVMGQAGDESPTGYLHASYQLANNIDPTTADGQQYLGNLAAGNFDTEPDIFSFQTPTGAGKFFLNRFNNFQPTFLPYSPVKITPAFSTAASSSFDMLDESGIEYSFGSTYKEITTSYNGGSSHTDNSAWMMEQMISANKSDSIHFTYTTQTGTVNDDLADRWQVNDDVQTYNGAPPEYSPNQNAAIVSAVTGANATECLLNTISYKGGKIVFELSAANRLDLTAFKSLAAIRIYTLDNSTGIYNLLKTVVPFQSYFMQSGDASSRRLRLDSLQVLDNTGQVIERYSFAYDPLALPNPKSKARDLWGYYNGKLNNSLIPQQQITFDAGPGGGGSQQVTIGSNVPNGRDPDPAYNQASVLKRINYPTGGHTDFAYETNQYTDNGNTVLAGGLRIHTISSFDGINPVPVTRTFEYNQARANFILNNSYFNVTQTRQYYFNQGFTNYLGATMRVRTFLSSPTIDFVPFDVTPVVYPVVTEYLGDAVTNSGKTVYRFTDASDALTSASVAKPVLVSHYYARGQLADKSVYRHTLGGTYEVVHEEKNNYTAFTPASYNNVGLVAFQQIFQDGIQPANVAYQNYRYANYYIDAADNYLVKKEMLDYDLNNPGKYTLNTQEYSYGNILHQQITKTATTRSDGNRSVQVNKYPADYIPQGQSSTGFATLDAMITRNMQSPVIETWDSIQSTIGTTGSFVRSAQLNEYAQVGAAGIPVLKNVAKLEISDVISNFTPSTISGGQLTHDNRYATLVRYNAFDTYTNPVEYKPRNAALVAVVWDYTGQLPVAEVKGAASAGVAYTSFEADGTGGWTPSGNVLRAGGITGNNSFSGQLQKTVAAGDYVVMAWALSGNSITVNGAGGTAQYAKGNWTLYEWKLSNVSSVTVSGSNMDEVRLFPEGAEMTTYTYTPNIGMTTMCLPNGQLSYYEYDNYQRLKLVRDQYGNIKKTFNYSYTNKLPLQ